MREAKGKQPGDEEQVWSLLGELNVSVLHPCQVLLREPKEDWFLLIKMQGGRGKKRLLDFLLKSITLFLMGS